MFGLFCFVLAVLASPFKSKSRLEAENMFLQHQLIVLRRQLPSQIRLTNNDRLYVSKTSSDDDFDIGPIRVPVPAPEFPGPPK